MADTEPVTITSYIDGNWVKPNPQPWNIPVVCPANEQTVGTLIEADDDEVDRAVQSARRAFDSGVWANTSVDQRKQV